MCWNSEYNHDIIKGFFSGLFGGSGVFIVKLIYDKYVLCRDKNNIYQFMKNENDRGAKWQWRTTSAIAAATHLSEERVREVCTKHDKITRNSLEKEVWTLK